MDAIDLPVLILHQFTYLSTIGTDIKGKVSVVLSETMPVLVRMFYFEGSRIKSLALRSIGSLRARESHSRARSDISFEFFQQILVRVRAQRPVTSALIVTISTTTSICYLAVFACALVCREKRRCGTIMPI